MAHRVNLLSDHDLRCCICRCAKFSRSARLFIGIQPPPELLFSSTSFTLAGPPALCSARMRSPYHATKPSHTGKPRQPADKIRYDASRSNTPRACGRSAAVCMAHRDLQLDPIACGPTVGATANVVADEHNKVCGSTIWQSVTY